MRVAHILSSLDAGGIEKWLCDYTRYNFNNKKVNQLYFCINSPPEKTDFFEKDIVENGGYVYRFSSVKSVKYYFEIYSFFKNKKIDVVHSHAYYFSGLIMLIAFLAGVKVRVTHSHNASGKEKTIGSFFYTISMRQLIKFFATDCLAVSMESGISLYRKEADFQIIPCGINFSVDFHKYSNLEIRQLSGKKVITHVGSFSYEKNHEFIFEVALFIKENNLIDDFVFVFIGEGLLKENIKSKFDAASIPSIFLGLRNDVTEIHKKYTDVFIFPSYSEGLGLASLEAQAQDVYCIHSEFIPETILGVNATVISITLEGAFRSWAIKIKEVLLREKSVEVNDNKNAAFYLDFDISNNFSAIEKVYRNENI